MKRLVLLYACLHSYCVMAQHRYDVIIDEIMADPSPAISLPNYEWIELKNRSNTAINLQDWRISDAGGGSGPMPAFVLQPGAYVIVCSQTALTAMSTFGPAIAVTGFPSLDNDMDRVVIRNASGDVMHAIEYKLTWYRNELKQQGGWSLEMLDTNNPCLGAINWKASVAPAGGTPARKNAGDTSIIDTSAPQLMRSYTTSNSSIILVFNEPVDSSTASIVANYSVDKAITIVSASAVAPLFNEVQLTTASVMLPDTVYTVSATGITDCSGQAGGGEVRSGLPLDPLPGEWIINELLFNPRSGGDDYVEYYNHSRKIFDAFQLYMATRNGNGTIANIQALSNGPYYLFPGDHIVTTESIERLSMHYLVPDPGKVLVVASLPSFPDKEGTVIALNSQGIVTDEVSYKEDWHFPLIANNEGVALERIDPAGRSQDKSNWHSAASTAGYGTPGYRNSQYKRQDMVNASVEIKPTIVSPDNDGIDDIATVYYRLNEPGYTANITIFDAAGRLVRYLVRNGLLGIDGYWNWDGLGETKNRLAAGIYIVVTELFNKKGKRLHFKNPIVVAYKL